jgi:hypothetical protein
VGLEDEPRFAERSAHGREESVGHDAAGRNGDHVSADVGRGEHPVLELATGLALVPRSDLDLDLNRPRFATRTPEEDATLKG